MMTVTIVHMLVEQSPEETSTNENLWRQPFNPRLVGVCLMDCQDHSLIVHVAVLHHSSTLLVKYRDPALYDSQTGWFLPNDSLKHTEHPEAGAKRVLKEQAGIDKAALKLAQIESFVGDNGSWHIVFDYIAIPNSSHVLKGEGVSQAEWFQVSELPDSKEFAHNGWGRGVLMKLTNESSTSKQSAK